MKHEDLGVKPPTFPNPSQTPNSTVKRNWFTVQLCLFLNSPTGSHSHSRIETGRSATPSTWDIKKHDSPAVSSWNSPSTCAACKDSALLGGRLLHRQLWNSFMSRSGRLAGLIKKTSGSFSTIKSTITQLMCVGELLRINAAVGKVLQVFLDKWMSWMVACYYEFWCWNLQPVYILVGRV